MIRLHYGPMTMNWRKLTRYRMIVVAVVVAVTLTWSLFGFDTLRLLSGLFLALFLPGYFWVRTLWPTGDYDPLERLICSVFFSLAVDTAVVYFFDLLGIPLSVAAALAAVGVACILPLVARSLHLTMRHARL